MTVYVNGQVLRKAGGGVGQQSPIAPAQQPAAPMAMAAHQQPAQTEQKVLTHVHSGHPDPHPIALRHSAAHTDPYHKDEDKLVDAFMKLADMANDGKATPEHMGQMDGIKIQLGQIQQKRTDEVRRLNQFMRQSINSDEQDASPGNRLPGGEQELPVGGEEGIRPPMDKELNDDMGTASTASATGVPATPQIGKAIRQPSTAGSYYAGNGAPSFMQKAVAERSLTSREKFGTKSDYALGGPGSASITPLKDIDSSASSTRPQGGTAKPNKSVFQKASDAPLSAQTSKADPQPVTEAVASVAPGEEPETVSGKAGSTATKNLKPPAVPALTKGWFTQGPVR